MSVVMCPAWLLAALAAVVGFSLAEGQCWDAPGCRDLDSEIAVLGCIQVCRSDLSEETPVIPGPSHLQVPPPDLSDPVLSLADPALSLADPALSLADPATQIKRSYSMEHFRWGKPVGRKRRPVKVYTSNDLEEESSEAFPGEMKRASANQLEGAEPDLGAGPVRNVLLLENEAAADSRLQQQQQQKKKNGASVYKMKHFRWSGPPESKRYGGFMKSWDQSQRPLLTLFRNVINKDQQLPV